jgi:hypothetical protein
MPAMSLLFRFIDWDLRRRPITTAGNLTLLIGMLPWLAIMLIQRNTSEPAVTSVLVIVIGLDIAWFALVGWRGWRLFRQSAARSDRHYDSKGKYLLPPEYAATESATKARSRRKKVR